MWVAARIAPEDLTGCYCRLGGKGVVDAEEAVMNEGADLVRGPNQCHSPKSLGFVPLLMPDPGRADDVVELGIVRLPAQFLDCFVGAGY